MEPIFDITKNLVYGQPVLMLITPQMAHEFLKGKARNRSTRLSLLRRLTKDITEGRWRLTGETIIFDNHGRLIDGQHRLQACINADKPIQTYVLYGGIDDEAQISIDTGAARQPGEMLEILGQDHGKQLASMCRWIYRYEHNDMAVGLEPFSRDTLIQMVQTCPDLLASIGVGKKMSKFLPPSLCMALHWLMAQKDSFAADVFFKAIAEGIYTSQEDPVYLLREALIRNKLKQARYSVPHMGALVIKAWNAIRSRKKTLKRLAYFPDRPERYEAYPKII